MAMGGGGGGGGEYWGWMGENPVPTPPLYEILVRLPTLKALKTINGLIVLIAGTVQKLQA